MTFLRVGTANPGKLREFREMLEPLGFVVRGTEDLPDLDIVEDGDSFAENAIIKARAVSKAAAEPAVADDSGLVVDALNGDPGIRSARYSKGEDWPGEDLDARNRSKLLDAMKDIPPTQRTARFVCALAYCRPNHEPVVFEGAFEGSIHDVELGEHGFGYDSVFLVRGDTRTSAQLSPAEKNAISHRAMALKKLLAYVRQYAVT